MAKKFDTLPKIKKGIKDNLFHIQETMQSDTYKQDYLKWRGLDPVNGKDKIFKYELLHREDAHRDKRYFLTLIETIGLPSPTIISEIEGIYGQLGPIPKK